MITYQPLSDEDREFLYTDTCGRCLHGQCYAFAIALHRQFPESIIMGVKRVDGKIVHVLLKTDEGHFDARGWIKDEEIGAPYGLGSDDFNLVVMSEEELIATRTVDEYAIEQALWRAQALWPDMPWRSGPLVTHRAFLEEVEGVCEKHGVYFYAPYATAWPTLTTREGGESIAFTPCVNSASYSFNRVLDHAT